MTAKPVLSTMWAGSDARWDALVEVLDGRRHASLLTWLPQFVRLARGRRAVVLRGTVTWREQYRDLVGAAALRLLRSPVRVVISDATIAPGSQSLGARLGPARHLLPALSRVLVRLADSPRVTWCVLSTGEIEGFSRTWGVPRDRVVFTAFSHTLFEPTDLSGAVDEGFVFSGGNSLRDYPLLVEAADGLDVDVVLATGWRPGRPLERLTTGQVSHGEFLDLLRRCRVLVLPIAPSTRSAGQQTYLNAMALGKVVIVTDRLGVRDHVEDGVTGVVVAPTVHALRAALVHVLDPANQAHYAEMGAAARERVLSAFTPDDYRRELLEVAGVLGAATTRPDMTS